ncbi:unnamed protein product [Peniophora sp. CBMAI 1063]|nr:unnamed protein product [Peniophora sp. CBMAI 1063]
MSLLEQPLDIIESIIDSIDSREDLLSLALTCARLRDLILKAHLPYRRVVVSIHFKPFLDLMKSRPDLASRVRELMLVRTTLQQTVPRGYAFRRDFPESRLLFASGYDDEFLYSKPLSEMPALERQVDILDSVGDALSCLTHLYRLEVRGDRGSPGERILIFDSGPFSRACLDGTRKPESVEDMSALAPRAMSVPEISGPHSLEKLQPSLRALHIQRSNISIEGYKLLDLLAESFQHLEELALPGSLSFRVPLTDEEKSTYEEGTAPDSHFIRRRPYLEEVIERLHGLRAVAGVALDSFNLGGPARALRDFYHAVDAPQIQLDNRWLMIFLATSRPLSRIRASYPLLQGVNCWRLDDDIAQEINMTLTETYELRRGEEYITLTRRSITSTAHPSNILLGLGSVFTPAM